MIKTLKRYKFWLSAVSLKFGVISMGRRFFQGSCRVNHPTMRLASSAVVLDQGSAARYHRLPVASTSRPSLRIPVSSFEFHFCRPTLGRVFGIGHHLTSFGTGSFAPGIRRHFSNALAPSDFGHRQVEWRTQHLEQFGFALRGIVRHNGSLFAPGV